MTTPAPPPDRPSGGVPGAKLGRDVRLFLGALAIIGDFILLYLEHVRAVPPTPYTTPDIIMHLAILVLGAFLMDPRRTLELINSVKDRLPIVGGK